jgi:glutamate N-acetyltransferase / amino-acid N-acetyltransferase
MEKVRKGIDLALGSLSRDNDQETLRAMMTTDLREKSAVTQFKVGGKTVTVAGVVKGSGMIAPSLATMISVVTTDAGICPPHLYSIFKPIGQNTYNAVTVDSDTSTSDTAIVLASGKSGVAMAPGKAADKFASALDEVCRELAKAIARDGEGASKLIAVSVTGAASDADAFIASKSVANSPLFKCAVHGGDPNWGRILCALGKSAAKVVAEKTVVKIGGHVVFSKGAPKVFDLKKVEAHLKGENVLVEANLGLGKGRYTAYGCDLSREYVAINADYST